MLGLGGDTLRVERRRWVVSLAISSILPLVVVGFLLVERLTELNQQRYDQEVAAARYATELAGTTIRQRLRDEFGPWRERLAYSHVRGREHFERSLRDLYYTNPLLDVPQFVEEAVLSNLSAHVDPVGFGEGEHRCELLVAASLQRRLIEEGRARMGYDPAEQRFAKPHLLIDEDRPDRETPLHWMEIDLDGPFAQSCAGCEAQLERVGVRSGERRFSLLTVVFPLPGGEDMRPGMFGAVVPAPALLREVIASSLDRWNAGADALPRHALRVVDGQGALVLPRTLPPDRRAALALQHAQPLYTRPLVGEGAPWHLEAVAISGFDLAQLEAENARWTLLISLSAGLLALGVLLFARSLWQQTENAKLRAHLLSNVGHELKTPLSLIRLYTETLESGRVRDEEEAGRFLGIVGREAKRLTHLIDNLLDVQRIEEGRKQYSFAQVRPDRVVRQTIEAYRYQLAAEGFDLRLDVDDDLPLLYLDEEAIAQALINLLDNAAKYSDTTKEIRVRCAKGHEAVRLSVQDRGIGIPRREQQRIFESFYRVEKTLVHDVKGSGLGLAVVAHVARAHGGRVEVESTPGKGSTFTLVLPLGFEPQDS